MKNLPVLRRVTSCVLVGLLVLPCALSAQTHVVQPTELQREVLAATSARQQNMKTINGFLSSTPQARKALGAAGIDPAQVKTAVSSLSDQELARLAARVDSAQADFAAGRMSDRDLLYVLLGIAALILIIVAVH
ncbi:PA2779 family protein [uncultured Paludibaculum sp.]|uniref:PA2779 family protein n=1 Tax=uncultured Paludibaculum sp. TaxID=1765020 RepID=UPI002AAA8A61|nr:PA2779 family protein [uncultured Paludibaculum sp.]